MPIPPRARDRGAGENGRSFNKNVKLLDTRSLPSRGGTRAGDAAQQGFTVFTRSDFTYLFIFKVRMNPSRWVRVPEGICDRNLACFHSLRCTSKFTKDRLT